MTNVILSTRKAAAATMDTVTTTVTTVASAALSLGHLASVAEAHASAYLETSRTQIALDSIASGMIAEQRAAQKVTEHLIELDSKLKDKAYKATFDQALNLIRQGMTAAAPKPSLVA
jgi:flagellar hook-basal body complex protein FliE